MIGIEYLRSTNIRVLINTLVLVIFLTYPVGSHEISCGDEAEGCKDLCHDSILSHTYTKKSVETEKYTVERLNQLAGLDTIVAVIPSCENEKLLELQCRDKDDVARIACMSISSGTPFSWIGNSDWSKIEGLVIAHNYFQSYFWHVSSKTVKEHLSQDSSENRH